MTDRPLTSQDYAGWRYTCRTHEWMSMREPCPSGDGTDNGPDGLGPKEKPR